MKTVYCNVYKPSTELILSVMDLKTLNAENIPVTTVEGFRQIIQERKIVAVLFHFFGWPRRAVPVNHPKLDGYFKRLLK